MAKKKVTASITAQNTFTDWVEIQGYANLSVSGISDSTVTVQRSFDGGTTKKDVESYTEDTEKTILEPEDSVVWRVGIKTGDYGSDTVLVRISQ